MKGGNHILSACASILDGCELAAEERALIENADPLSGREESEMIDRIRRGGDPLGDAYMSSSTQIALRAHGETYTPPDVVDRMVGSVANVGSPANVVDVGCGSGRFARACARVFPAARVVAVDASPFATLMAKAAVRASELDESVEVLLGDFTTAELPSYLSRGQTLWIGNPPYVRHHDIPEKAKRWLAGAARSLGYEASALSGLHAYFVLAVAQRCRPGDFGALIMSAEWLDTNYGGLVRSLFVDKLGITRLELFDKETRLFDGIDTTSVVASFSVPSARGKGDPAREIELVAWKGDRQTTSSISAEDLRRERRWSRLFSRGRRSSVPSGYVRLGEFARVHRGIATGANKFWVRTGDLDLDERLTVPVVSHAREITSSKGAVLDPGRLARLIALPQDVESLRGRKARDARRVITEGEKLGIDKGYVASSRKCWWSIPLGDPAPILMTYMARRPPTFVANPGGIRSLNVVHGVYPMIELSEKALYGLVEYLNGHVSCGDGRTYCGGLTKFEPREAESIIVPSPEMLEEGSWR